MIFWNFFVAWARVKWARFRGYEILAPPEVTGTRWHICDTCPFFNNAQCDMCGCLVQAKISISVEECPIGRWDARWVKKPVRRHKDKL